MARGCLQTGVGVIVACVMFAACGPRLEAPSTPFPEPLTTRPAEAATASPPESSSASDPPIETAPPVNVTTCPREEPVPIDTLVCLDIAGFDGRITRQGLYDPDLSPPYGWRQIDRFTAPRYLQIFVYRRSVPDVGAQCDESLPRRVRRAQRQNLVQFSGIANALGEPLRIACLGVDAYEDDARTACENATLTWCTPASSSSRGSSATESD